MRTRMASALTVLVVACSAQSNLGKSEQAIVCQGTLSECLDGCRPTAPAPDCDLLFKECKKAHPNDKQRCRKEKAECKAELRERRDALKACLKICREEFEHCTPADGCEPPDHHGHHHPCEPGIDPAAIDACIKSADGCMNACQDQGDQCVQAAASQIEAWLDSINDRFNYCVAQAGGNYDLLLICLGNFPKVDLACIQANANCFMTCNNALKTCLEKATEP